MKLHYFADAPNFGDALNPWLWPQLLGDVLDDDDTRLLLGIGTILKADLPAAAAYHVLGAGAGYGNLPVLDARWHLHAVRGPLTAQALGLAADRAVTDGAYLLRTVPLPAPDRGRPIGFMPHFRAMPHVPWRRLCDQLGLRYLDPLAPVPATLAAIRGCDCLITEAMHGAIVADACRVPWVPVLTGGHVLDFKWCDWLQSVELEYTPRRLASLGRASQHQPGDSALRATARRGANALSLAAGLVPLWNNLRLLARGLTRGTVQPRLSSDSVVAERTERLTARLADLRRALAV